MLSAVAPLTFLLFIDSRTRKWYQLHSRWVFSPQLNIIESALKDPQRYVSHVIINPVKLTMMMDHHTHAITFVQNCSHSYVVSNIHRQVLFHITFPVPCQPLLVIETVLSYIAVREEQICRNCSPKASEQGCFTMLNMRVSSYCEDKMYLFTYRGGRQTCCRYVCLMCSWNF